jgi:hypothetical protein
MTGSPITRPLLAAMLAVATAACGTPKPVLETAQATAANASLVNSSLEAFKENGRASADRRRQFILPVAETTLAMESGTRQELSAKQLVEDRDDREAGKTVSAFAETMIAHLDTVVEQERQADARAQELSAAMAQSYTAISVPSDQLKSLAKALSDLADQPSRKQRLELLRSFFVEAYKFYKESEQAANDTTGEADAAASTAAGSAPTDSSQ